MSGLILEPVAWALIDAHQAHCAKNSGPTSIPRRRHGERPTPPRAWHWPASIARLKGRTTMSVVSPSLIYRSRQGRWVLIATVGGSALASIDTTVAGIALPVIGRNLDTGLSSLQWSSPPTP